MYGEQLKAGYQHMEGACATSQSEIQDKFSSLESNLHYLSAALENLESRLIPVLRMDGMSDGLKASGAPQPILSPVAERLNTASQQALSASSRIDKLLHLLAL